MPPHPYPVYPSIPLKYLDRRIPAPTIERYQRSPNQQINFNPPFSNQNIPPTYGPVPGNCMQNRAYPYSPDSSTKPVIQNRLYIDSGNSRKYYPNPENLYINDINRQQPIKNDVLYPSYTSLNIHSLPPHHMYRKESPMKGFEHATHYRNIEHAANMNALSRLPLQFSPQTISISPSDSNTSNDAIQALNNTQEDCGYVSQSSTASVRSVESGINRISSDIYRRNDLRYDTYPCGNKSSQKLDVNNSKDKKGLNVRQFLQMWNEGDDETNDNNKEVSIQKDSSNSIGCYEPGNNQEQLYVLGLVNVPNEELGKYDHIEKISKLPENIKGYNSIELLNQYEKLVESPSINHFNSTPPQSKQKDLIVRSASGRQGIEVQPRPISPLDVEAKISQSVIHKEVGCNFEIRPCSPQIMNVDVATPVHNILNERLIEKVVNPVVKKSPMQHRIEESINDISSRNSPKVASCKMVNNQFPSPNISDSLKTNYCLHDMENNSGLCLASLPRLDNDIELNFPEINQQFINANKIDTLKTSAIRDLPILDAENVGNTPKNRNNLPNKSLVSEHLNSGSESDKEGSKLSKYRKHKRSTSVANEICHNSNPPISLHRTDSVIIKNPDNVKTCEEDSNHIALMNNNADNAVNPINLIVEGDTVIDYLDQNLNESVSEKLKVYPSKEVCETAIDFSLNKTNDEHSTCINTVNNLSDSLQNNVNTNKATFMESETSKHKVNKLCNTKSPTLLEENSVPDEFPIIQSNSPTLGDFECHDMINSTRVPDKEFLYKQINTDLLNNKTDLESLDEENLILKTDKDIVTVQSVSSLHEEMISQKDSSILCLDLDNVPKTLISPKDITVSNSDIINDNTGNKILNYEEDPKDLTSAITESDYNLLESAGIDQNCINIENNSSSDKDTEINSTCNALKVDNVSSSNILDDMKIDSCDVKNIHDFEIGHLHTEINESRIEEKETNSKRVAVKEEDILISKGNKKIEGTFSGTRSNLNIDLSNECSDKCNETESISNISKEDITNTKINNINDNIDQTQEYCSTFHDIKDKNDFKVNLSGFELPNIPSSETVTMFDNNQQSNIINTKHEEEKNTESEKEFDISISNTSYNKESTVVDVYKTKSFYKKELFSPWIQYLLLNNEGLCTSQKKKITYNALEANNIPYGNNNHQNFSEINLRINEKERVEEINSFPNNSVLISQNAHETSFDFVTKSDFEGNTSDLEHIINKNADMTRENIEESNSNNNTNLFNETVISSKTETGGSKEVEKPNCFDAHNECHKEIIPENIKENIHPDTFIEENHIVESSLELMAEPKDNDEIENTAEKNNETNIKLHDYVKENTRSAEHISKSPILGRRSRTLKRSLSDSAAKEYNNSDSRDNHESSFVYRNKRTKVDDSEILVDSHMFAENFTSFIQSNRRNSISTIYNDENVSFCILIDDDCVLTDENEECQKICYTEIPTDCLHTICTEAEVENTDINAVISYEDKGQCEYDNELIVQNSENNPIEESWVEDVACMETVFSDDIAEDIEINAPPSPKDSCTSDDENDTLDYLYNVNKNEHTNKVKCIYGNQMCDDDAQLVEKLYRTPQMDVNKTLINRESQSADDYNRYYDNESLEKILSESNTFNSPSLIQNDTDNSLILPVNVIDDIHGNKENLKATFSEQEIRSETRGTDDLHNQVEREKNVQRTSNEYDDSLIHSCESSCDVSSRKDEEKLSYTISSSPEVSSTTSEEKSSGILLKIRSYKGTKISEINEMGASFNCTQSQSFNNSNCGLSTSRPLITKAAQKYIPPLKETIRDLKVKLHLPKQSLYKLQQLKKSKEQPKKTSHTKHYPKKLAQENPKKTKPKPKFEDVLKSIDEIQFKMHKEKHRKSKQSIPKVIIKKNENGAHYASTKTKETFNPDLTGRKWQPWVFIEKSNFIDKMALKQKFKAIYNHRKKTYVLAENFRKYKSINNSKSSFRDSKPSLITNSKFLISHPKSSNNVSSGKLKYTFKLKHN